MKCAPKKNEFSCCWVNAAFSEGHLVPVYARTNCYGVTQRREHLSRRYKTRFLGQRLTHVHESSVPRLGAKIRRFRDRDIDTLVSGEIDISAHANKTR